MVANDTVRALATLRSTAGVAAGLVGLLSVCVLATTAFAEIPSDITDVRGQQVDEAIKNFHDGSPNVEVLPVDVPSNVDRSVAVIVDEISTGFNPDGGGTTQVQLVPGAAVPDLFGTTPSDAQNQLTARGLIPSILSGDPAGEGVTVIDQNVTPESLVNFNTTVGYALSAAAIASTPPAVTPSTPAVSATADDSVPWIWIVVGTITAVVLMVGAFISVRLMRRPRKPPATVEAVEVRARAPAPPTTHTEPLDNTPSLSLWLDPHPDHGDQVLEEVTP